MIKTIIIVINNNSMGRGLRRSTRIKNNKSNKNYVVDLINQFINYTKENVVSAKDIYNANCSMENKIIAFSKNYQFSQLSIEDENFIPLLNEIKSLLKEQPGEIEAAINPTIDEASKKQILTWIAQKNNVNESSEKITLLMHKINYASKLPYKTIVNTKGLLDNYDAAKEYLARMNERLHSMQKIKTQLLQSNFSNSSSQVLAFCGPPGIGKTQICRAHAHALGLPISFINIGAIKDSTFLKGSLGVWLGAEPGAITKALISMGAANGIIVFDEIDKIDEKVAHNVYTTLLEILDPSQNKHFTDEFLPGINIDLSNITFLCTMNDEQGINPILLDRMKVLHCDNYSASEKITIIRDYFIPTFSREIGITTAVTISDEASMRAINGTMRISASKKVEPGVRLIQKIIKTALEWINFVNKAYTTQENFAALIGDAYRKYPIENNNCISEQLIDAIIDNFAQAEISSAISHIYL